MLRSCWKHASGVTLGIQAIEHHRKRVRFFSTVEPVNALEQEKAQGKAEKIADALVKTDLVILGALGYLPFSASGGALVRRANSPPDCLLILLTPPPQQALRTHQRHHHHQPELQRMGQRLRRRKDDHRLARSPHPSLPHFGDRQRQLPLQGQLRNSEKRNGRKHQH